MLCDELICMFLGPDAVAEEKMLCGRKLVVLGVFVEPKKNGFRCSPSSDKVLKWTAQIEQALRTKRLAPGATRKLSGRLSWGASALFQKLGRACSDQFLIKSLAEMARSAPN